VIQKDRIANGKAADAAGAGQTLHAHNHMATPFRAKWRHGRHLRFRSM